jgi:hypothetical protein
MKQQIYYYQLFLFNKKDYIYLNQEQGQKLAIALSSNDFPKYILIDNDIINTSAIERLVRYEEKIRNEKGDLISLLRELTQSEEETNKTFQLLKNKTYKLTSKK